MIRGKQSWFIMLAGLLLMAWAIVPSAPAQPRHPHRGPTRPSPADCDAYARHYARETGPPVLGGAARGAGKGALFGAIIGGGKGAGRGAALGGLVGGVKGAARKDRREERAYYDCMSGRMRW